MAGETKAATSEIAVVSALLGLASFLLYLVTLAPTIGWGDSADLALRIADSTDTMFLWGSRDYVLYRSAARFFQSIPYGDAGLRANLATAFFGGVSVGLVGFLTGYVGRSRLAAVGASLSLAVAHSFWFLAVTAEVYTFNAMLALACFAAMAVWYRSQQPMFLPVAAFFAGLTLSHHASGLVLLGTELPLFLLGWRLLTLRSFAIAVIAAAAAAALYWQRTWIQIAAHGLSLETIGLGAETNGFFDVAPLRESAKLAAYIAYNFAGPSVVLIFVGGLVAARKCQVEIIAPLVWAGLLAFAGVTSSIPDKFDIYVLVYPSLAILVGLGLAHVAETYSLGVKSVALLSASLVLAPIATYAIAASVSRPLGMDLVGARQAPYRDREWYFLWPPKNGDYGPRRYAEEALKAVEPGALIVTDYTLWRPMLFMQKVEHLREDVELSFVERQLGVGVDKYVAQEIERRPVYFATDDPPRYYQLDKIEKRFTLTKEGVVFRLGKKSE